MEAEEISSSSLKVGNQIELLVAPDELLRASPDLTARLSVDLDPSYEAPTNARRRFGGYATALHKTDGEAWQIDADSRD